MGVVGLGLGIALGHVECHAGKVEVAAGSSSHHAEEGTIEGEVVGFGEEVIRASEGGCLLRISATAKRVSVKVVQTRDKPSYIMCIESTF